MLALGLSAALATTAPPVGDFLVIANTSEGIHSLTITYTHPQKAPEGATASLDVPAGLGVGASVAVTVRNVPKGQSEPFPSQENPGRTYQVDSTGIADLARLSSVRGKACGTYRLQTSYTGGGSITLGEAQDFLAPVSFTEPARQTVDLSQPIKLSWTRVPRVVGYSLRASATDPATGRECRWEAVKDGRTSWYSEGTIAGAKSGRLLPADRLSCTIPAGIFLGSRAVRVILIAYSADVRAGGSMHSMGWAQSTAMVLLLPK